MVSIGTDNKFTPGSDDLTCTCQGNDSIILPEGIDSWINVTRDECIEYGGKLVML